MLALPRPGELKSQGVIERFHLQGLGAYMVICKTTSNVLAETGVPKEKQ